MPARKSDPQSLLEEQVCNLVVGLLDYVGASEMGRDFEQIESDCLFGVPDFMGGRGAIDREPAAAAHAAQNALEPLLDAIESTAPLSIRRKKQELIEIFDRLQLRQHQFAF